MFPQIYQKKVRIGHFWFPRYRRSSLLPGLGLRLALQVRISPVSAVVQCFHVVLQKICLRSCCTMLSCDTSEEADLPHEPDLPALSHPHHSRWHFLLCSQRSGKPIFTYFGLLLFNCLPSDSWPAGSLCDNSPHIYFHVQCCSKPHSSGNLLYDSELRERLIFLEGFLHESS